jgi:hypothetical protein
MHLQPKITYGLIGGIILAALELGLFVTKGDLYQNFVPRTEVQARLDSMDRKIDRIMEMMADEKK